MRKVHLVLAVLVTLSILSLPKPSSAQVSVGISVRIGPPPLPVYAQPICPGSNYIWTPGYWAWGPYGYYWVPGTWVLAPEPGYLWTPGYWAFASGFYIWHPGYWGPHVGFYGGINYGHGYFGIGYVGGEWRGRVFTYNRAVSHVNVNINHNYYNRAVIRNERASRISYNGGPHGIDARPTREQRSYERERHHRWTAAQERHEMEARQNRAFRYSDNHGRPPIAATPRPGEFNRRGSVARPNGSRSNERGYAPGASSHEQGHNFGEARRENSGATRQRDNNRPRQQGRQSRDNGRSRKNDHGRDRGRDHGRQ